MLVLLREGQQNEHFHDVWICDPRGTGIYGFTYQITSKYIRRTMDRFLETYYDCKSGNMIVFCLIVLESLCAKLFEILFVF